MRGARKKVEVLWLAKGLGPGGMERLLVHHARLGDHRRFGYSAGYLVERPNSVVPELEELGVPCHRFGSGRGGDPRWVNDLRRYVTTNEIDVVHVHSPSVAALARPALRTLRSRPRVVYTEHNSWDCYSPATRVANAITYPLDDVHLAVSEHAVRSVSRPLRAGVRPLVHGIDTGAVAVQRSERDRARVELGVDEGTTVITTVANLRREKAYDVLLTAAARVVDADRNVVFLSVGQGPLEADLRVLHGSLGLGGRFRFLGFRPDAVRVLAASDVFTLSSRHEGLPVSLMEAMALGLPIVATRAGGMGDVLVDGSTALVVPVDDPSALASALTRVVEDPGLRTRLARGSEESAPLFDAARAVSTIEDLYVSLVGGS